MEYEILRLVSKNFEKSNQVQKDVVTFLALNDFQQTARHSGLVAVEAKKLALRFGENQESAANAALLHDISAVFPNKERISVAKVLDIIPLPEEEIFPLLIHQRISEVMAAEIFGITDQKILSAIGCHTTLKRDATKLDKILFVADKIRWDQDDKPPYLEELLRALEISLDMAALSYLEYMWKRRDNLIVVHPWLREAYEQLSQKKEYDA
jgi:predicted HD superfamily hydrolase involved in NAD metabolism